MKNDLKEKFNHKIKKTKNRKYDFDTISGEKLDTVYFPNEFGEKYFLLPLVKAMFSEFIFFKSFKVFFLFLLNLSNLLTLFKLFAASMIGRYPVQRHKFPEIES